MRGPAGSGGVRARARAAGRPARRHHLAAGQQRTGGGGPSGANRHRGGLTDRRRGQLRRHQLRPVEGRQHQGEGRAEEDPSDAGTPGPRPDHELRSWTAGRLVAARRAGTRSSQHDLSFMSCAHGLQGGSSLPAGRAPAPRSTTSVS